MKMKNPEKPMILFFILATGALIVTSKSTIEPCSDNDTCNAMLGYTLYADLKVSEVASLFQIDPISLLLSNSIDISYPDVENHILPSNLFMKIPISCSCTDGIRKSVSTRYKTRPADTLASIASSVYGGLVSADQLAEVNSISGPSVLDAGHTLIVPLPCTCFNNTDNALPAVYLSYVVREIDTLTGIAARYFTTVTDLMNVNALGSVDLNAGDILSVPLTACASKLPIYASDYGLIVPTGSYATTASHCVQCSCVPGSRNLSCEPSSMAVACSSMKCRDSKLMIGNFTSKPGTSKPGTAGCKVTSCSYNGYVNGTILTSLSRSLQPRCPGPQQFPPLIAPPTTVPPDPASAPAPAPYSGIAVAPESSMAPSSGSNPANGPIGSSSSATSSKNHHDCSFANFLVAVALFSSAFWVF